MKPSKVVFDFGTWDITVRELIAAPTIIGVLIILGFVIAGKIDNKVQEQNLIYNSAPHVETVEDFKDRLATDKRPIFASGHLSTLDPVGFNSISSRLFKSPSNSDLPGGNYLCVEIEREHYTKHTRTVTDSDGNKRKETYYTWDHEETVKKWANTVVFNDVKFPSSKFDFHISEKSVGGAKHFDDRWIFRAIMPEWDGILFTEVSDGNIKDSSPFYVHHGKDINALVEDLTSSHGVLIFWILWSILIIGATIGFFYIDNRWLE